MELRERTLPAKGVVLLKTPESLSFVINRSLDLKLGRVAHVCKPELGAWVEKVR